MALQVFEFHQRKNLFKEFVQDDAHSKNQKVISYVAVSEFITYDRYNTLFMVADIL